MTCSGCSNAVNKALTRLEGKMIACFSVRKGFKFWHLVIGIEKIDISLEKQEVVVDTELPRETVLAAIKKTGKTVKE